MLKRILILLFIFIIWPMQIALADYKTLATRFAQDPNSLSVDELAELRKCVNDKLREKLGEGGGSTGIIPPPPPAPIPMPTPIPPLAPAPR
ncbi:MAG: hypothetical protein M0P73_07790 [Syntrophobacterales bacterium]|jgi:hypothetical protein|nr:hypothetical protein [Syntrophobacterales bacterium]